jgi:uncharacterized membrane protein YgaE (UPF0421/DUF939 family)
MTVRHCQVPDNFRPDDGLSGWKRIVAALLIAAAAIATLWLTGSIHYATVVAALIFVPLGVTLRR